MRWNTPTVRGMLQQVKRLVVIETEAMYMARKQKAAEHRALRAPIVVNHSASSHLWVKDIELMKADLSRVK
ncbi:hypothetical protein ACLOJK_032597 [Asimina triloba]